MKTKEDLRELFNSEFKETIAEMEDLRKRSFLWGSIVISLLVLTIVLFLINMLLDLVSISFGFFVLIFGFVLIVKYGIKTGAIHNQYCQFFKQEVMLKIIEFINPNYNYSEMEYIPQEDFEASGITRGIIKEYKGDDLVTGIIDKTPFKFSELHVTINNVTNFDKKIMKGSEQLFSGLAENIASNLPNAKVVRPNATIGDKRLSEDFHGLFFMADFNKQLNEQTFVVPEKAYTSLGKENKTIQGYGELIKLENPEFEKNIFGLRKQSAGGTICSNS